MSKNTVSIWRRPCFDGRIAMIVFRLEDEPNGPGEPLAPRQPPPPVRMVLGQVITN
jgi:hypothetical protein